MHETNSNIVQIISMEYSHCVLIGWFFEVHKRACRSVRLPPMRNKRRRSCPDTCSDTDTNDLRASTSTEGSFILVTAVIFFAFQFLLVLCHARHAAAKAAAAATAQLGNLGSTPAGGVGSTCRNNDSEHHHVFLQINLDPKAILIKITTLQSPCLGY